MQRIRLHGVPAAPWHDRRIQAPAGESSCQVVEAAWVVTLPWPHLPSDRPPSSLGVSTVKDGAQRQVIPTTSTGSAIPFSLTLLGSVVRNLVPEAGS
jgi:hypothetical protein